MVRFVVVAMLAACGGGPPALVATPDTVAFDDVVVGATGPDVAIAIANSGGSATDPLALAIDDPQFAISATTCTGALAAGDDCAVSVHFTPAVSGPAAATLSIHGGAGFASVSLVAKALDDATLAIDPDHFDYGMVAIGAMSASRTFTVTNTGDVASGVPAVSGMGDVTSFAMEGTTCAAVLPPGASCTVSLTFAPTSIGAKTAMLLAEATPGGAAIATVTGNAVAIEALEISPVTHDFGDRAIGTTSPGFTFTVENPNGVASDPLVPSLSGTDATRFAISATSCTTLGPSASCTVTVVFSPLAIAPYAEVLDVGGTEVTLTGNGVDLPATTLVATPASNDFGFLSPFSNPPFTFTIANTGSAPTGTLTAMITGADATSFMLGASTCSAALAAGATCTVDVTPTPVTTGSKTAILTVAATNASVDVILTGTCCGPPTALSPSPAMHDFGALAIGTTSAAFDITITNGTAVTTGTISAAIAGANAPDFSIVGDTCTTLSNLQSCKISIAFAPGQAGMRTATLTISATPGGTTIVPLSGTGL